MRNLPQPVVNRALANGVAGRDWLNQLDSLIADLESLWHISVGDALSGGTAAFVAPADGKRGRRCVLRIDMPGDSSFDNAVHALELADGRGYVRLIASDAQRHACLLERLGAPLRVLNAPVDQQLDILCDSLNHAWLPISDASLPGCAEASRGSGISFRKSGRRLIAPARAASSIVRWNFSMSARHMTDRRNTCSSTGTPIAQTYFRCLDSLANSDSSIPTGCATKRPMILACSCANGSMNIAPPPFVRARNAVRICTAAPASTRAPFGNGGICRAYPPDWFACRFITTTIPATCCSNWPTHGAPSSRPIYNQSDATPAHHRNPSF